MGKIKDFINKNFYEIFNDSHLIYTLIFFISAFLIALLSLFPYTNIGNAVLFLSTSISLTYILLMFISLIPTLEKYLFSEEKRFGRYKIIGFFGVYLISFIIILIYFIFGSSANLTIEFMGWDILLPTLFIVVFFGWNLLQILFLRSGMEILSEKIENKIFPRSKSIETKETFSLIFLILATLIAPLLQIFLILFYIHSYSSLGGDLFIWFIIVNTLIALIISITSWRLISLFLKSRKNNTSNIFSSLFYIFIWLYMIYRIFSFFNSLRGEGKVGANIFTSLIDILLMVITAGLVLRSLGGKIVGAVIFNKNNMPFFLYAFTMLYIQGQIIMITGAGNLVGIFSNRNQVNLVNNFMIFIISFGFYLWYSSYMLQRKGLIERTLFTREEIIQILFDYSEYLGKQTPNEQDFKIFLENQGISSEIMKEKHPTTKELESQSEPEPKEADEF
ncbi:MAG: hypothetical protein ACQERB_12545 [Promethearchaeati archaeon]